MANREEVAEQYVEGQLCPWQQEEFEIHLLECPKCLITVETLSEVQMGMREREEIRAGVIGPQSRGGVWMIVIGLIVLGVLLGAGYFWTMR